MKDRNRLEDCRTTLSVNRFHTHNTKILSALLNFYDSNNIKIISCIPLKGPCMVCLSDNCWKQATKWIRYNYFGRHLQRVRSLTFACSALGVSRWIWAARYGWYKGLFCWKLLILLPIMIMGREQESGTTDDGSKRGSRRHRLHFHAIWLIFGIVNASFCYTKLCERFQRVTTKGNCL